MHPRAPFFATIPLALMAAAMGMSTAYADTSSQAQDRVDHSARLIHQLKQDPKLYRLLSEARGVFIIPHYGKAGFIVGGQGGGGAVLAKRDGRWTDPAFFNIGRADVGYQAEALGGSIVMLLMTQRAVDQFEHAKGKWSFHAAPSLTVARYSGNSEGTTRAHDDIIVWTDTHGLYGELTAGATDITRDDRLDHDYYKDVDATPYMLLSGRVEIIGANDLRDALTTRVAER